MPAKAKPEGTSSDTGGCLPVFALFVGVVLLFLQASLAPGTNERRFLGFLAGFSFVVYLIFTVVALRTNTKEDKYRRTPYQELLDGRRERMLADLGKGSSVYFVTYSYGHKGIDHYLRWYVKKSSLEGMLGLSGTEIQFTGLFTRTTQRFRIPWSQVTKAEDDVVQSVFSKTERLVVSSEKYSAIHFRTQEAPKIARDIKSRLKQYREDCERLEQLEQEQIRTRNLDAISPYKFEELVGKVFEMMGFQVSQTGGPGDQGVDLICRNDKGELLIVQCKRYKSKVSVGVVRDFYGALIHNQATSGYIITTSDFTGPARQWAINKPIILVNRHKFAEMLEEFLPADSEKPG